MQLSLWVKSGRALAMAAALVPAAAQATLFDQAAFFDFENIAAGTPLPFTETLNGLSATFTGNASICASGGLFVTLTGNVSIQELCSPNTQTGPLGISFSEDLSSVSFDFATAGVAGTLTRCRPSKTEISCRHRFSIRRFRPGFQWRRLGIDSGYV
jgi:hypothetical protein